MSTQLPLDLPLKPALGRDDFFVSEANQAAVLMLESWEDWPHRKLLLIGPSGAGKTHLAHVWAAQTGAQFLGPNEFEATLEAPGPSIIEDADQVLRGRDVEEALFHLHNACATAGAPLLITARTPPAQWGLGLPDLESRMAQASLVKLTLPDDALLMAIMVKQATDRQITLSPRMLSYLLDRIPRSFEAAEAVISRIDALSLAEKRRPNQSHVRTALAAICSELSS